MPRTTPDPRRLARLLPVLAALSCAGPSAARTFTFPHIIDHHGRVSNTQFTFDTSMFITYTGAVACVDGSLTDQLVHVYLFDDEGRPLTSLTGDDICAPCSVTIGATDRSASLSVEAAAEAAGGMPSVLSGFAVVVVEGDDTPNVNIQGYVVNSHTNAFDLSVFGFTPEEVRAPGNKTGASFPCGRVFSVGRMLATPGAPSDAPYTFDTTMFFSYAAGLAGEPPGPGATVETYLFDEATGELLVDAIGTPVCNPCVTPLSQAAPKASLHLGALLPGGGIVSAAVSAVCVVSGDAGSVAAQAFVVNRHTSALDVSIFAPAFRELSPAFASSVPGESASRFGLRNFPNPFNPRTTFAYSLSAPGNVRIDIHDADGNLVRTLVQEGQDTGAHEVTWDGRADNGRRLPSGVYFGRIETREGTETRKVTLVQ
jgi:hypothetical protein